MTENDRTTANDRDPIGTVAEEARKLFDSLQGRATRHVGKSVFHSFTGGGRSEKDVWSEAVAEPQDEYVCRACPVCRAIAAQRESGGDRTADVATHLVAAGGELFAAFRDALDVLSSRPTTRARDERGRDDRDNVEHIDLD
ncbi:DUF5304 family protein [Nonomuraea sp. MCN248]|uniref:DUF5304 family protein n=1 Tax=Nonomuraea corallina TaxID=2989783 RepID=A0ABT4SBR8_9ACTN|nr:DUF5304 family protein [Nonomuraea corallina]MDA0634647.1 DUF5304 family protein [Nonomuraea corallina]